jgi:hypothetical protein
MTEIADIVADRGITEILHFSTNHGLTGILAEGAVISRMRLPRSKYLEHVYKPNAKVRRDGPWLDYVNLSVSRLNTTYFEHSNRWHQSEDVWWCALSFDPLVLEEDGVLFATTNNMYSGCRRKGGAAGLEALFASRITCWSGKSIERPSDMPTAWPTDRQAEALYPAAVSTQHLQRIYVATGSHHDIAASSLDILLPKESRTHRVSIVIAPEIFDA